jgi:hypothetical protein
LALITFNPLFFMAAASGLASSLLEGKYDDPPREESALQNGHVIHLLIASDRSPTNCADALLSLLHPMRQNDKRFRELLRLRISRRRHNLLFTNLKASQRQEFLALCEKPFFVPKSKPKGLPDVS